MLKSIAIPFLDIISIIFIIIVLARKLNSKLSQESISLNNSTNNYTTCCKQKYTTQQFAGEISKIPRKPNIAKSMAKIHDQKLQQQLSQHESHCPQAEHSSASSLPSLMLGSLSIVEYKLSRLFPRLLFPFK